MKVTVEFMSKNFDRFNKMFFANSLNKPLFKVSTTKRCIGQCIRQRMYFTKEIYYTIRISNKFNVSEKNLCETLIHEMIHLYMWQQDLHDNGEHGKIFQMIMNNINNDQKDYHISITVNPITLDVTDSIKDLAKESEKIICLFKNKYGELGIMRIAKNMENEYKVGLPKIGLDIVDMRKTRHPIYNTLVTCRNKVKYQKITDFNLEIYLDEDEKGEFKVKQG